jgi:sugar porter (SP) family MFS transporter
MFYSSSSRPLIRGQALLLLNILLISGPSYVVFGYNQVNLGGLLSLPDWNSRFPLIDTTGSDSRHTATIQGLVVSTFTLGAMPGSLSCIFAADRYGRRPVIFFAACLSLVGQAIEASSYELGQLIVGRVIAGFAVGQLSTVAPLLLSECTRAIHRGRQVVLCGTFLCLGYAISSWVNYGFYQIRTGPIPWRVPITLSAFFALLILVAIIMFPESPRWLVQKNRISEAVAVLAAFRNVSVDDPGIQTEVETIQLSFEMTRGNSSNNLKSLKSMLSQGKDRVIYRFLLCIGIQFCQQMCGGNVISVYSTVIFTDSLKVEANTAHLISALMFTWKFASSFVSFYAIDRLGRRTCFMVSGAGMSLCMMALTVTTRYSA